MYGAFAIVINSTVYITGGRCPNDTMGKYKVYKYELNNNQWSDLPDLQQCNGIPVNINDHLTIIGGKHSTTKKPTDLVTTYSDDSWNNTYPNLSVPRYEPAVVPYNQCIIVGGGKSDDNTITDSIEIFDISESHWITVNTRLHEPMYNVYASLCGDSFAVMGYTYEVNGKIERSKNTLIIPVDEIVSHQQDLQAINDSTVDNNAKWQKLADISYWFTVPVPNASPPIIVGGHDEPGNTVDDITMYDDAGKSWKKIESLPFKRSFTTVVVVNQCIIVMGGCSDVKNSQKTCDATALTDVKIGKLVAAV